MSTKPISYADAGVSIDNANIAVAKIREYARSTFNERTLTEIGSFGGMFAGAFPNMSEPILVASADGVGTKLKLAFDTGIQPSAVTLLAGDRYFFIHGSSFQPRRISHIAQLRSTPALYQPSVILTRLGFPNHL